MSRPIITTELGFTVLFQEFILFNTSKLWVIPRHRDAISFLARSFTFPAAGCHYSWPGSGCIQACRALMSHVQPHQTEVLQHSCLLPAGPINLYGETQKQLLHTLPTLFTRSCTQIMLLPDTRIQSPHLAVVKHSKPQILQNILHMNRTLSAPSDPGCTSPHRGVKYTLALQNFISISIIFISIIEPSYTANLGCGTEHSGPVFL